MSEVKFYLELTGRPLEGHQPDEVAVALAHLLRTTGVHARDMLRGERSRIKRELDKEKAVYLMEKITACGAECELTPSQTLDNDQHSIDAIFDIPGKLDVELDEPELDLSLVTEMDQPKLDLSLVPVEIESEPPGAAAAEEPIATPEPVVRAAEEKPHSVAPIRTSSPQKSERADSKVVGGRQKMVSVLIAAVLLLGVAVWAGVSFMGGIDSPTTSPPSMQSAKQTPSPAAQPEAITEVGITEKRMESLAHSVRIWMIQYGAGFDPSQVTMERMEQDLALSPEQMKDGWGVALRYTPAEGSYTINSAGPDRVFGNKDDISVKKKAR